jgi:hypothetical protein
VFLLLVTGIYGIAALLLEAGNSKKEPECRYQWVETSRVIPGENKKMEPARLHDAPTGLASRGHASRRPPSRPAGGSAHVVEV